MIRVRITQVHLLSRRLDQTLDLPTVTIASIAYERHRGCGSIVPGPAKCPLFDISSKSVIVIIDSIEI